MKLTKTQIIIVALLAIILVWYFFLRKNKGDTKESNFGISECKMLGTAPNQQVAASNNFPCHYPNSKRLAYESTI